MYIQEQWIEVRNHSQDNEQRLFCGSSGLYEPYTDNIGKLFLALQREYGKCNSKIYIDTPDKKTNAIGWVFEKLQKYDDCNEYYLQETWVELHDEQPDVVTTHHYHTLKG